MRCKLKEAEASGQQGMTHDSLNRWCQDRMRELTEEGKVVMRLSEGGGDAPQGFHVAEQVGTPRPSAALS